MIIFKFLIATIISGNSLASKIVYQPAFFKSDSECADYLTQDRLAYLEQSRVTLSQLNHLGFVGGGCSL